MYSAPPRILCIEVRTFLTVVSAFGAIAYGYQMIEYHHKGVQISGLLTFGVEFVTFLAAIRNSPRLLKFSLYFTLANAFLFFLILLIVPIYLSNRISSGIYNWTEIPDNSTETDKEFVPEHGHHASAQRNFSNGLHFGYISEALMAIACFGYLIRYVLLNRMYIYAKQVHMEMAESQSNPKQFTNLA